MGGFRHKRKFNLRQLLLLSAYMVMLASAGYYLYEYRNFAVDDTKFAEEIREAAARHNIDSRLVRALIYEESRFRPGAIGRAGEVGLMQVMPNKSAVDWARSHRVPGPERGVLFSPFTRSFSNT